jgi:integrase
MGRSIQSHAPVAGRCRSSALCAITLSNRMERSKGLVFGRTPDRPFTPTAVQKWADDAWEAAEPERITLHAARHTFASILIDAGVNAKAITTYMGHASITVTFDLFGHLMPGNEDEAAALVDAYLERANTAARLANVVGG